MKRSLIAVLMALVVAQSGAFGHAATTPSRDPKVVVPLLRKLNHPWVATVEEILGHHDRRIGSGRCILVYVLRDRSEIRVNTGDCLYVGWITREHHGKSEQLY